MFQRFNFSESVLKSVVGGKSSLDMPKLNIKNTADATAFLQGYGFDIEQEGDLKKLWYFHRRALVFLEEKLGFSTTEIPEILRDPKQLGDIRQLLLFASSSQASEHNLQKWSCALLRVIHIFVHTENDLFSSFSEEIQKQILSPFQNCILHDGTSGKIWLKKASSLDGVFDKDSLALLGFEIKPFKTSTSTVIKLLAKPDALAMSVYDKLGVRFVTHSMVDAFRVVRFLVNENLISYPHIMPDQSSNNLYPINLFCEVAKQLKDAKFTGTDEEVESYFKAKLEEQKHSVEYLRKENFFSGPDYKFIKFISRKLIRLTLPDKKGQFSFFFPYEIQIMDQESHQKVLSGPAEHQAYKERQRLAARRRVLPELDERK